MYFFLEQFNWYKVYLIKHHCSHVIKTKEIIRGANNKMCKKSKGALTMQTLEHVELILIRLK